MFSSYLISTSCAARSGTPSGRSTGCDNAPSNHRISSLGAVERKVYRPHLLLCFSSPADMHTWGSHRHGRSQSQATNVIRLTGRDGRCGHRDGSSLKVSPPCTWTSTSMSEYSCHRTGAPNTDIAAPAAEAIAHGEAWRPVAYRATAPITFFIPSLAATPYVRVKLFLLKSPLNLVHLLQSVSTYLTSETHRP
jgi:hypothetical protein